MAKKPRSWRESFAGALASRDLDEKERAQERERIAEEVAKFKALGKSIKKLPESQGGKRFGALPRDMAKSAAIDNVIEEKK